MNLQDLTLLCHHLIRPYVGIGTTVVDATAGNGHDTKFLAEAVGPEGRVYAFDAHEDAIANTRKRLDTDHLLDRVILQVGRHEHMHEVLPDSLRHEIHGFMFNLGYLPGGDKAFATRMESTVKALQTAERWLAPGGFISILAYRGHAGGPEEADAVEAWLRALPPKEFEVLRCDVPNAPDHAPVLYVARKKKAKGL